MTRVILFLAERFLYTHDAHVLSFLFAEYKIVSIQFTVASHVFHLFSG